ncbi:2OG-Fe(II) oxygenase [Sphingomonas sp. 1P06PA]|uniref:prolyl hydroxylase family protein n=1 Tax=Sphingomonas sp. 1P06PA TaxID=554121 RepID=UPI0039A783D7
MASVIDRANELAEAGDPAAAAGLLAESGDGDALFLLARWRLAGTNGPRDLAAARALFARAAKLGRRGAAQIYAAFLGSGTGGERDWSGALDLIAADPGAQAEHGLIAQMALDATGDPLVVPTGEPIAGHPIIRFPALFSVAECAWLVGAGKPRLAPAVVVDPVTARPIANPVRTSGMASFPPALESPAVHALNRRLAAASGTMVAQGEPLQLLAYAPGQEYRAHVDAVPGTRNQRIMTMLVWLNAAYDGGATRFLDLGIDLRGQPGDAILFHNVDADGAPDMRMRHAGLPVTRGVKFLASRWIRERAMTSWPPED